MVTAPLMVYAGAKAYGMRGKILHRKDLQMLAESRDLDELVIRIKNTVYGEAATKIAKPYTAQKIEIALRDRLADRYYSMMLAVGGSKILSAYYRKFVLRDMKLILKGKILGREQSEIEAAVSLHAEEIIHSRDIVLKALIAKNAEEAVSVLKSTGLGGDIDRAYTMYGERKQIQILDVYFDKFYYDGLSRVLRNPSNLWLRSRYGMEIDYYDMMCVLRSKFWEIDEEQIQDMLVPQISSSSKEILTRMVSADSVKNALSELLNTKYKDLVPQHQNPIDAISEFEQAFDRRMFKAYCSGFVPIFSISTIIAVIKLLEYEVRNLSAITFAVEQGISADAVMERVMTNDTA